MQVFGKRILVESTRTKKKATVDLILPGNVKNQDDVYDYVFKVIQVGPDCPTEGPNMIAVGDTPIFGKYCEPAAVKMVEKDEKKDIMIVHSVYHLDDIVGKETDL